MSAEDVFSPEAMLTCGTCNTRESPVLLVAEVSLAGAPLAAATAAADAAAQPSLPLCSALQLLPPVVKAAPLDRILCTSKAAQSVRVPGMVINATRSAMYVMPIWAVGQGCSG